ncbi:MAG: hypothetical protein KAR81_05525 [Sulfurimonas sp.]|nr:hypothetical protein [Sulfurimonas sp.]
MFNKKIKTLAIVLLMSSSAAFAGITGSPHDLSANTLLDSNSSDNGEICVYCHTPHAANTSFVGAPLWNKASPGGSFTMYGTTIAGESTQASPANPSLACLSCHDGVSAIDSILNAPGSGMNTIAGSTNITEIGTTYGGNIGENNGTTSNMQNDHPISITYVPGNASLKPIGTALAGWMGATEISHLLRGAGADQVECGSCHDPHNGGKTQGVDTEVNFLRHSNTNSDLCLGCHDK